MLAVGLSLFAATLSNRLKNIIYISNNNCFFFFFKTSRLMPPPRAQTLTPQRQNQYREFVTRGQYCQHNARPTISFSAVEVCIIREFPWVPWESHGNGKHRLNSWKWEREWEWWTGNGREMGIAVWKKLRLVVLIIFWHHIVGWLAEQFGISS